MKHDMSSFSTTTLSRRFMVGAAGLTFAFLIGGQRPASARRDLRQSWLLPRLRCSAQ
jgi:hypothetical protein